MLFDKDVRERIKIRELEYLKGQLRASVSVTQGGFSISSGDKRLGHGPKPFISHDVSLTSYWDPFTKASAALKCSERISPSFNIDNVQWTEEVIGMLAAALRGKICSYWSWGTMAFSKMASRISGKDS